MKILPKLTPLKANVVLTTQEKEKLVSFFNLLINIDKRVNGITKKRKTQKRKAKGSYLLIRFLFFLATSLSLRIKNYNFKNIKVYDRYYSFSVKS